MIHIILFHFIFIGEVNCEEQVPNDDREKYYLLWKELGVANQLNEYNVHNTSTESIIFGMYLHSDTRTCAHMVHICISGSQRLYKEANCYISKSAENMMKLQALEQKLEIMDDDNRQACLHQGKDLAIRRKLLGLQANMELYFLSIKRKLTSIQSVAST